MYFYKCIYNHYLCISTHQLCTCKYISIINSPTENKHKNTKA